jgi:SAM-dependent methyltransferase
MQQTRIDSQQVFQWDVLNWSQALPFWLSQTRLDLRGVHALEIGAGENGGLSLWLASLGATVVCSDCDKRLAKAQAFHQGFQLSGRIDYEVLDASHIPYENNFDLILFKSVLGSIGNRLYLENQQAAVLEMHKALRPGGELMFAENLIGTWVHMALRRRFGAARYKWRYLSLTEFHDVLRPFSSYSMKTCGFVGALGRNHFQRQVLGGLDGALFNWLIPPHMRYIVFGLARKSDTSTHQVPTT